MQTNNIPTNCVLCYDDCTVIGIFICNHGVFCYKCVYKMRELNHSKNCPICAMPSELVIYSSFVDSKFQDYDLENIKVLDAKKGTFCASNDAEVLIKGVNQLKCFAPNCKETKIFESLIFLTRHLKEKHQRYICQICYENKKCLINEHILYSRQGLDSHMKSGDMDDEGFVYFFHPYCTFCDKLFFDEDRLTVHMTEHFTCHICVQPDRKYLYYNNYQSLEQHFRGSHYLCEDHYCLQQAFKVFKTLAEFGMHNIQVHKVGISQMEDFLGGFTYDQRRNDKQKNTKDDCAIRDKEGVDFTMQFLSQQKTKFIVNCIDEHEDSIFDFRDFYNLKYDEDVDESQVFKNILSMQSYRQLKNKIPARKKEEYYTKINKDKGIYLEDLRLFRWNPLYVIEENTFNEKLEKIVNQDEWDEYHEKKQMFFKKKISAESFFQDFIDLIGQRNGYRLFPFFIRTIQNEVTAKELDKLYVQEISKLPKKVPNLINTSESYTDFFDFFRNEVEENIVHRIETKRLNMKIRIKMDRQRIFQLIEILRRVKTHEMSKLKFITNFGLSLEGINYITRKVYFTSLDKLQSKINKIPTPDFLKLYLYLSICDDMLKGKYKKRQAKDISTLLLKDFLIKRQDIRDKYCKKYKTDQSDYSDEGEKKRKFFQNLAYRYNYKNDFLFPTFPALNNEIVQLGDEKVLIKNDETEENKQEIQVEQPKPLDPSVESNKQISQVNEATNLTKPIEIATQVPLVIKQGNQPNNSIKPVEIAKQVKNNQEDETDDVSKLQNEQLDYLRKIEQQYSKDNEARKKKQENEKKIEIEKNQKNEQIQANEQEKLDKKKEEVKKKWDKNNYEDEEIEYKVDYDQRNMEVQREIIIESDEEHETHIKRKQTSDIEQENVEKKTKITYKNDSEDEPEKNPVPKQQQGWGSNNRQEPQIVYEIQDIGKKLKKEMKEEESFPSLGGLTQSKDQGILSEVYKKPAKVTEKKDPEPTKQSIKHPDQHNYIKEEVKDEPKQAEVHYQNPSEISSQEKEELYPSLQVVKDVKVDKQAPPKKAQKKKNNQDEWQKKSQKQLDNEIFQEPTFFPQLGQTLVVKEEVEKEEEPIITNEEEILLGIKNKKVVDKWSHPEHIRQEEEPKEEMQVLSKKKNKKGKQVLMIPGGFK